LQPG
jgi:hypothetical protein